MQVRELGPRLFVARTTIVNCVQRGECMPMIIMTVSYMRQALVRQEVPTLGLQVSWISAATLETGIRNMILLRARCGHIPARMLRFIGALPITRTSWRRV